MTVLIDNQTGEIIEAEDAFERHVRIVALRKQAETTFLQLGKELHEFVALQQFKVLGYSTFNSYIADPEVDIGRSTAAKLIAVHRHFIRKLGAISLSDRLIEAGYLKSELLISVTTRDNVQEWLEKAGALSRSDLRREIKEAFPPEIPPLPDGKYRVIYADPPWKYGNTMPDYFTEQADYYALLTVNEICTLPIKDLAGDNSVLFLWATSPILEEAFDVIRAWGFKYKTSFVWDKVKHVMGHYNSVRHEFLLVCTRGSCQPDKQELFDSVVTEERSARHSEKPESFRQIIDILYTWGPKIELFARKTVEGWDAWGDEIAIS